MILWYKCLFRLSRGDHIQAMFAGVFIQTDWAFWKRKSSPILNFRVKRVKCRWNCQWLQTKGKFEWFIPWSLAFYYISADNIDLMYIAYYRKTSDFIYISTRHPVETLESFLPMKQTCQEIERQTLMAHQIQKMEPQTTHRMFQKGTFCDISCYWYIL